MLGDCGFVVVGQTKGKSITVCMPLVTFYKT